MNQIRQCSAKGICELAEEWDSLANERHRQIQSGQDISFKHVIAPMAMSLLGGSDPSVVLDIGSGTGDFTKQLAAVAKRVIAIEPSPACVALARDVCGDVSNVQFVQASLEESARLLEKNIATAAVASMTLMAAPDLVGFAKALAALLQPGARFVATITHPCFWPKYWRYENAAWFNYTRETFVEAPFAISNCPTDIRTTHVHRPVERYVKVFQEVGFRLTGLSEPIPEPFIQALYPSVWSYPRFLGFQWEKVA